MKSYDSNIKDINKRKIKVQKKQYSQLYDISTILLLDVHKLQLHYFIFFLNILKPPYHFLWHLSSNRLKNVVLRIRRLFFHRRCLRMREGQILKDEWEGGRGRHWYLFGVAGNRCHRASVVQTFPTLLNLLLQRRRKKKKQKEKKKN